MDFMNLLNQLNATGAAGAGKGGCGLPLGGVTNCIGGFNPGAGCGNNNLLPLLLLCGLGGQGCGQTRPQQGNMTCYPMQQPAQQFVIPGTGSCCGCPQIKYRKRKVKEAYMTVPVSTYQVANPMYPQTQVQPGNMNIVGMPSCNTGSGGFDIFTLILLCCLLGKNNNCGGGGVVCCKTNRPERECNNDICTTDL